MYIKDIEKYLLYHFIEEKIFSLVEHVIFGFTLCFNSSMSNCSMPSHFQNVTNITLHHTQMANLIYFLLRLKLLLPLLYFLYPHHSHPEAQYSPQRFLTLSSICYMFYVSPIISCTFHFPWWPEPSIIIQPQFVLCHTERVLFYCAVLL